MESREPVGRTVRRPPSPAKANRRRILFGLLSFWPVFIPVALAAWTYHSALHGRFVFDDVPTVEENLSLETIGGFWNAAFGEKQSPISNRPLVCLTFAIDFHYAKLNTFRYHLFNLLVHCANVMLLWGLLRRTLTAPNLGDAYNAERATWTATAVAAVWAVHPLGTEAVVYVTQRTTLMMSFFLLLMFYASLRAASDQRWFGLWYGVSATACALAMTCKEEAVAAPILLVLFDRAFIFDSFNSTLEKRWLFYAGSTISWVLLLVFVLGGPENPTVGYHRIPQVNAFEWLMTEAPVLVRYMRLVFWPQPLIPAYDWDIVRNVWQALLPGLFVLGVLGLSTAVWFWRPRWGWLGAWFFLMLAPTSSIMPIVSEVVAERRMYLPMLSLLIPAVLGLLWVGERLLVAAFGPLRYLTALAALPLCVVIFFESRATAEHARIFDDENTLWTDVFKKNPLTNRGFMAGSLLNGYAKVLLEKKRHEEAIPLLRRAIDCDPPHNDSFVNLAAALVDMGPAHYAEADELYRGALARDINKTNANLLSNYAKLKLDLYQADAPAHRLGPNDLRMKEAYAMLQRAHELNPRNATYLNNLGSVCFHLQRVDEAERAWSLALQLEPGNINAASNKAVVLAATGRRAEAAAELERLRTIYPNNVTVLINLATVYQQNGNTPSARQCVQQALAVEPNNAAAQLLMQQLNKPAAAP